VRGIFLDGITPGIPFGKIRRKLLLENLFMLDEPGNTDRNEQDQYHQSGENNRVIDN